MAVARTRSRFDREDAGPRNDVYTGLLAISLVAMLISCLLLYLDYNQYPGKAAPPAPPAPAPKSVPIGQLPPPPPIEERPTVRTEASAAPVKPVSAVEQPGAQPVVPAVVELLAPAPTPPAPLPVGDPTPPAPAPVMPVAVPASADVPP